MDKKSRNDTESFRKRERLKIILGTTLAFVLLALVLVLSGLFDNTYDKDNGSSGMKAIQAREVFDFVKSGKTDVEYKDTEGVPGADALGRRWYEAGYEASGWKTAAGSFGSVDGQLSTRVNGAYPANLLNHYASDGTAIPVYYFRMEFEVEDFSVIRQLSGKIQFDDAVVVYLNGEMIFSDNVPEEGFDPESGYGAGETVDKSRTATFTADAWSGLVEGRNCIAVEVHQANKNSSDVYFDLLYLKGYPGSSQEQTLNTSGLILQPGVNEKSREVNWLTEQKSAFMLQYCKLNENFRTYRETEMEMRQMDDQYCYKGDLTELISGSTYLYRIRDKNTGALSAQYTVKIPSDPAGFTFLFAGDPQIGADDLENDAAAWERTLEVGQNMAKDAAFIISAGDQADSSKEADALLEYQGFRSADVLKSLPVAVNRGNHDSGTDLYDLQFKTLNTNNIHDDYFMYQDVLFVSINSNNSKYEKHVDFLKKAIEQCQPRWIVVTMHYSMFSTGPHAGEDKIVDLRNALTPEFSKLGVDLVLSGHDHLYARSYLMEGLTSTGREDGAKADGQTLYLAGTSSTGSKFYEKTAENYDYIAFYDKESTKAPLISSITIQGDTLTIKTVRVTDLKLFDTCTITK